MSPHEEGLRGARAVAPALLSPAFSSPALLVLAFLSLAVVGCAADEQTSAPAVDDTATNAAPSPQPAPTLAGRPAAKPATEADEPIGTAAAQLAALTVAGRAPMTGYDRDRFGQAWLDADRNGCDTRNDILRRDLRPFTLAAGTHGCVVLSGVLADPYTNTRIDFVRGESYSVDIDHVVALGNAWASGAWRFDIRTRAAMANDPLNLLAVDAGENRSKSDSNAASWLPPNRTYRCAYVARQVAVKAKYHLAVTDSEKAQIARQLTACPGQPATPDVTHAPTQVDQRISDPGVAPRTSGASASGASASGASASRASASSQGSGSGGGTVQYQNCDAARAAGAAPVHRGEPGYGAHLDRDGDGTACE